MKTYSVNDIVKKVRVKLDEIAANESEMNGLEADNVNVDTVIKSCIGDAYRLVTMLADVSLLEGKHSSSASLAIDEKLVGRVSLPKDFLRCLHVRLSSWASSCSEFMSEDSPEYRMQSNKWTCGTPSIPAAALVYNNGSRTIELFKASSKDDKLSSFIYIPVWNESSDTVEVSDQTSDAFIYFVAALTLTTFREDLANDMFKVARGLIGLE